MTFKRNSILDGFRECGLVPYNPNIVLNKIQEYQPLTPLNRPSTPPDAQIWPPVTPLTAQSLEKQAIQLQNATPSRQTTLQEKFIKGALIQAKTAVQIQKDLSEYTAAERERKERRCRGQRQLQNGGVLYAEQARNMTKQREEEGGTQEMRAQKREQILRKELEDERRRTANLEWTIINGPLEEIED
ncbi:hypothetical protein EPUS_00746 [Endocarpon pusillum Z07020]|uniref:Uncharacterized protein n=1 Tax=Endocarpon pusillum (strain Z07020 / HMAS-L-300199) TaxID=1263415 RepID=U1GRL7_ENDPU|nr:uncharacterized protein EPUS_00746 [Endocarpon pusillum Z07020]ERF74616.1 hypothetical protein EPUS_00746 [Endocarpon pusillum Z07020]